MDKHIKTINHKFNKFLKLGIFLMSMFIKESVIKSLDVA